MVGSKLCVLGALTAIAASGSAVHESRSAQIREIRNTTGVLWKAEAHPRFAAEPPGASKVLCGVNGNWKEMNEAAIARGDIQRFVPSLQSGQGEASGIPESFDSLTNWPQCAKTIGDIRDQSACGCCWAFGAAEAASDRMCIATNGKIQFPLSAQEICFCASDDGCHGGDIFSPWSFIQRSGAVTGGQYHGTGPFGKGLCSDFSLPHCHHHGPQGDDPFPAEGAPGCPMADSPQCPTTCDADADADHKDFDSDRYTFTSGGVVSASGEADIQRLIMEGGPVETAFDVYSDFENYAGGIYHHVSGDVAGGHAVRMVGWGTENGHKYWKVANSWNPHWGEQGYFRIKRGNNEGGIENSVTASSSSANWGKKTSTQTEVVV